MEEAFHDAHKQRYGHALREHPIEVVNLRVQTVGRIKKPHFEAEDLHDSNGSEGFIGHKKALFHSGEHQIALYEREKLLPGTRFKNPALIFQMDSTTLIPPNWSVQVDKFRNLILSYNPSKSRDIQAARARRKARAQ